MRTLIRASQLHPDVSGLVSEYTSPLYPNYNDILAGSGLVGYISGDSLVLGLKDGYAVSDINGLSGSINFSGFNGLKITKTGSNIYFDITGFGFVGKLNNLSGNLEIKGSGLADIWPSNSNTITVNVPFVTGGPGVSSYFSGGRIYLATSFEQNIGAINGLGGDIEIYGEHGISIRTGAEAIYVNAYDAAHSGVHSINDLKASPVTINGGKDISITSSDLLKSITVDYNGSGWGNDYALYNIENRKNINWIGDLNFFDADDKVFVQGYRNNFVENSGCSAINAQFTTFLRCKDTTTINSNGSFISGVSGSTLINPFITNNVYQNNNSLMIGTPNINTFYNSTLFVSKISGYNVSNYNPIKFMKVPKSNQDSIFVATGSVLIGHLDYVAAAYHITDFFASSNITQNGMYGRKYFTVQRTTALKINIRDEADLFGGSQYYNIQLSGAENGRLYLISSGYSGHDVFFMGNMQYTQFNLNLIDE